jgi:putative heme-binding domain-containing protein
VPIESIAVFNRTDGDLGKRLEGFTLAVLDGARGEVHSRKGIPAPREKAAFDLGGGGMESLVRRAAMEAITHVRGQEADAFRRLARFARDGIDRDAAVRALLRVPPSYWPADEVRPLLVAIVRHVREIPARDRTAPAALDALQLGEALAARLEPAAEASRFRSELGELGVRVIRLAAVPHQMLYDKDTIAVLAGKPFEIVFENNDLMPHNLVVGQPGSLEEIGLAAEAMATAPGALEKHYVPGSGKVLAWMRLLQPRQSDRIAMTAPEKRGVYPYVCTYPGHWRRMFGALYVVADLEKYLANPAAYLEANPLPIEDDLLKLRRPRKEWKLEDLAASLGEIERGRSFGNGKQLFQAASCNACHRVDGAGVELGPDLAQLDPKLTPPEILRDILEPSAKINEKFQAYTFLTASGEAVTGLLLARTPEAVKVAPNPLVKAEPVELKVSDIAEESKSATSIMPEGLLNQLTREEILDLLAFVVARGKRDHAAFQGGHDGHGH